MNKYLSMNVVAKTLIRTKLAACIAALIVPGAVMAAGQNLESPSTPQAGWEPGKTRFNHWKYKDEKPVQTISAENMGQHAEKLSPGQQHLLKTVPGYKMAIYPTHRSCTYPDWYKQNTIANKTKAKLDGTGNYLTEAVLPGRAFDEPKSGAEAMWNWLTRYQGIGYTYQYRSYVSPAPGGSEPINSESVGSQFLPWGQKGATGPGQVSDVLNANFTKALTPAALAGQAGAFRSYFSKPGDAYYYFPGQRRVRRMPTYTYDAPQIGFENQYTVDDVYGFYGAIDRFDWKITGKKTIYVPYNNFAMHRNDEKFAKAINGKFIAPEYRRYEAHEVVVVEGKLKSNVRHLSARKTFYFDVDTWNIVAGEDYDAQGKLFKYREMYTLPAWELEGVCTGITTFQYNFQSSRFVGDNLVFEQKSDVRFFQAPNGQKEFKLEFYTPSGLQAASER